MESESVMRKCLFPGSIEGGAVGTGFYRGICVTFSGMTGPSDPGMCGQPNSPGLA